MRQELEQLRREKQNWEARPRRKLENMFRLDSDSSDEEVGGEIRQLNGATKAYRNVDLCGIGKTIYGMHGGMNSRTYTSRPKKPCREEWREKMERKINECKRIGSQELAAKIAKDIGKSPFTDDILNALKPQRFTTPIFQKYDGTIDPVDHIKGYKQQMAIETIDGKLMCKLFPSSLTGPASAWFQDLKPQSILNFDALSQAFISHYFCSRKQKKDVATLFSTKQNSREKIGQFFERFKAEMQHVNCEPHFAVIAFREGLLPNTPLYESMLCDPPKDMDDVVARVEGEIQIERAKAVQATRVTASVSIRQGRNDCWDERGSSKYPYNNSRGEEKRGAGSRPRDASSGEWFTVPPPVIYQRHKHEGIFSKPPPQLESKDITDRSRYCPFHETFGHGLSRCEALKLAITSLMKERKLLQYRSNTTVQKANTVKEKTPDTEPIVREILDIHGAPNTIVEEKIRLRSEICQAEKIRRVCQITEYSPSATTEFRTAIISFSPADAIGVQFPHRDPFVITTQIKNVLVRRVMIDQGSSADILFRDTFDKLKLDPKLIHPSRAPLTVFEGSMTWPVGEITIPVTTGGRTVMVDFVVINKQSTYNALLGRNWLHKMEAETSTHYQVLKFISDDGARVVSVKGNQLASKALYVIEIKRASSKAQEESASPA